MRRYPVITFQIDGPCFEIRFHDAEGFLDFPTPAIHIDDDLRIIVQVRADSVEPIKAFLFFDGCMVQGICLDGSNLAILRHVCFLHEAAGIVRSRPVSLGWCVDHLHGALDLTLPDAALIQPVLERECDNKRLVELDVPFLIISLDISLLVENLGTVFRRVFQSLYAVRALAARQVPAFRVQRPVSQGFFHFLDGLGGDKAPIAPVVELPVGFGGETAVCAYDKLRHAEVPHDLLLQGLQRQLLVLVSRHEGKGQREPGAVHEKPHADDGAGAVLLAAPVLLEPFLGFRFKEVVGAVIVEDAIAALCNFFGILVQLCLHEVHLFGKDGQGAVDMLYLELRLLIKFWGKLQAGTLGRWEQDSPIDQPGQDGIQVIGKGISLGDAPADRGNPELIVDLLQEEIADVERVLFPELYGRLWQERDEDLPS